MITLQCRKRGTLFQDRTKESSVSVSRRRASRCSNLVPIPVPASSLCLHVVRDWSKELDTVVATTMSENSNRTLRQALLISTRSPTSGLCRQPSNLCCAQVSRTKRKRSFFRVHESNYIHLLFALLASSFSAPLTSNLHTCYHLSLARAKRKLKKSEVEKIVVLFNIVCR